MKKTVLLFLGDADRLTLNYEGVAKELAENYDKERYLTSVDAEEIKEYFSRINTDTESLLVTVLAHGGLDCISARMSKTEWMRLPYTDLLGFVGACRTAKSVLLNLIAPCNTKNIVSLLPNYEIDEVWYNVLESDSLYNGLTAAAQGFNAFSFMDEEQRFFRYCR